MQIITSSKAPAPIGPYNQAVIHNGLLYMSGQIAIDPATGNMVLDNIQTETHQVMRNLQAVLEAAGTNFNKAIKTTIFLSDMSLFTEVNEVYGGFFDGHYPARETVAVKGLPKGVNVEISMLVAI
ncbi:MAG: RidA family protein [Sphingobacteriaceae bacterium]|jgi:2-iminobutanoate/2-iminopropanoate deaminase|nr:RidA family protein [Sphingobacteriaceae bacterium]